MSSPDACITYLDLHERLTELLSREIETSAQRTVPHCPSWTVKDTLAHMVGVPEDILTGSLEGVTTPAWTQRQVDRHVGHTIADLLHIWNETLTTFAGVLPKIPQPTLSQFIFDQVTHEHDIRHTLSQPGARDSSAIAVAEGFLRHSLAANPDTEIHTLSESQVRGFDFVRSLSGRRTVAQIEAVGLPVNAVVAYIATSPFRLPTTAVNE